MNAYLTPATVFNALCCGAECWQEHRVFGRNLFHSLKLQLAFKDLATLSWEERCLMRGCWSLPGEFSASCPTSSRIPRVLWRELLLDDLRPAPSILVGALVCFHSARGSRLPFYWHFTPAVNAARPFLGFHGANPLSETLEKQHMWSQLLQTEQKNMPGISFPAGPLWGGIHVPAHENGLIYKELTVRKKRGTFYQCLQRESSPLQILQLQEGRMIEVGTSCLWSWSPAILVTYVLKRSLVSGLQILMRRRDWSRVEAESVKGIRHRMRSGEQNLHTMFWYNSYADTPWRWWRFLTNFF